MKTAKIFAGCVLSVVLVLTMTAFGQGVGRDISFQMAVSEFFSNHTWTVIIGIGIAAAFATLFTCFPKRNEKD